MGNINHCPQCKLEKSLCKICGTAYCIVHDYQHNKGVAHFGNNTYIAFSQSRYNTIDGSNQGPAYQGSVRSPRHRHSSHPSSPRYSKVNSSNTHFKSSVCKKVCPAEGCGKTPEYECTDRSCCGLFCSQHASHNHFKCQYDGCQQLATQSMRLYKEKAYCEKHYNFEWALIDGGVREIPCGSRDLNGYITTSLPSH